MTFVVAPKQRVGTPTLLDSIFPTVSVTYGEVRQLAFVGDHAFGPSLSHRIFSFDISDPTNVTLAQEFTTATNHGGYVALPVGGNLIAVAARNLNGVTLFDVTNPASIVARGFVTHATQLASFDYFCSYLGRYMLCPIPAQDRFTVVDCIDPDNPVIVASITDAGMDSPSAIAVHGSTAFVTCAGGFNALVAIDLTTPSSPSVIGRANGNKGSFICIDANGWFAYTALSGPGNIVNSWDIRNPAAPRFADSLFDTRFERILDLKTAKGILTVGGQNDIGYASVVDVRDPLSMVYAYQLRQQIDGIDPGTYPTGAGSGEYYHCFAVHIDGTVAWFSDFQFTATDLDLRPAADGNLVAGNGPTIAAT